MTEIQNSKLIEWPIDIAMGIFSFWSLVRRRRIDIVWNLGIVIWNFSAISVKADSFNLS
jgi:hypothetical protein